MGIFVEKDGARIDIARLLARELLNGPNGRKHEDSQTVAVTNGWIVIMHDRANGLVEPFECARERLQLPGVVVRVDDEMFRARLIPGRVRLSSSGRDNGRNAPCKQRPHEAPFLGMSKLASS